MPVPNTRFWLYVHLLDTTFLTVFVAHVTRNRSPSTGGDPPLSVSRLALHASDVPLSVGMSSLTAVQKSLRSFKQALEVESMAQFFEKQGDPCVAIVLQLAIPVVGMTAKHPVSFPTTF